MSKPTVVSLNISPGGIPKLPQESVQVTLRGLAGDGHDHEKHNRATQAVSLIDIEDLDDAAGQGFDLYPGATGENVTVRGLQTDDLAFGQQLRFSGGVVVEYTKQRSPCFVLDKIDPKLQDILVGRCGGYAKVVVPGEIRPGETIELLDEPIVKPTGAVLIGGKSSRMGRPKHAIETNGKAMVEHVINALTPLCKQIVLVGKADDIPEYLKDHEQIADRVSDQGPLGGIDALLDSFLDTEYLVCPCDMPALSADVLGKLLTKRDNPITVFRDREQDRVLCMPIRLTWDVRKTVRTMLSEDQRAVHQLISQFDADCVDVDADQAALLRNVNTPQDLAASM